MRTVSTAGDFYGAWDVGIAAGSGDHLHIVAPVFFVEIDSKEAAGFVLQEWIDAENATSTQMRFYGTCVIGTIFRMGAIRAFSFRLQAHAGLPFVFASRTVARSSVFAFSAVGIYIRPPLKQREEECNFFWKRAAFCDYGICWRFFILGGISIGYSDRKRNAVFFEQHL